VEAALRRSGLSRSQAKGLIAKGYKKIAPQKEDPREKALLQLKAEIHAAAERIRTKTALQELSSWLRDATDRKRAYVAGSKASFDPAQSRGGNGRWSGGGGSGNNNGGVSAQSSGSSGKVSSGSPGFGGDSSPQPKKFDADKAARHAVSNVDDPVKYPFGNRNCAKKIREALQQSGIKITTDDLPPLDPELHYRAAKDYGSMMKKIGFNAQFSAAQGTGYPASGYKPDIGDVAVIQSTSTSKDGHMAIYTGEKNGWVSDFIQKRGLYPGPSYREEKPSYVIYRHTN
jgi:hypothetical protein